MVNRIVMKTNGREHESTDGVKCLGVVVVILPLPAGRGRPPKGLFPPVVVVAVSLVGGKTPGYRAILGLVGLVAL